MPKRSLSITAFIVLLLSSTTIFCADEFESSTDSVLGKRKIRTESDKRIVKIEQLVNSYFSGGSDLNDENTKEIIINKAKEEFPLVRGKTPREVNISKLRSRAEREANKIYPINKAELNDKFKAEADEKYQALPINNQVTITYRQGQNLKTISGRYFGLTYYNDGVRIENTVVPIFDMSDTDKSKFDEKLRELRKKQYVKNKIEEYKKQRQDYIDGIIRAKAEETVQFNEKNGFINAWSKWRTPEEVTNIIINYVIDKQRKLEEEKARANQPPIVKEGVELQKRPIDSGIADQVPKSDKISVEDASWGDSD